MKDEWSPDLYQGEPVGDFPVRLHAWVHQPSGLRFLHLEGEDPERFGAFCFPTYPEDNTGAPHILEHTVLCGSRRFPGRSTFFQLYRSSLSSFLNALTYPAATLYPFGSPLEQDFRHLFEVYADAVFFPCLEEGAFLQEGWHFERRGKVWDISGVVYNEMRGDLGSLEGLAMELVSRSLWGEGPLGFNSGGDPLEIPRLSWAALRDFHRKNYQPNGALFFLWGNTDAAYFRQRLSEILRDLPPGPPRCRLDFPLRRTAEEWRSHPYPAQRGDRPAVVVGWLAEPAQDERGRLLLDIILSLLVGEGGLIKRAVVDAGLAEDTDLLSHRQIEPPGGTIQLGFTGVNRRRHSELVPLLMTTLQRLVEEGFPEEMVEAEFRTRLFGLREVRRHQGLRALKRLVNRLLEPEAWRRQFERIAALQQIWDEVRSDPSLLSLTLETYLLANTHRVLWTFEPDPSYARTFERRRRQTVETALAAHPADEPDRHRRVLATWQGGAAAVNLPRLEPSDLPRQVPQWPAEPHPTREGIFFHRAPTGGIAYVDIHWDLSPLGLRDPLLGLAVEAFGNLDLRGQPYDRHVRRQKRLLGDLDARLILRRDVQGRPRGLFHLHFSALAEDLAPALDLIADLLRHVDPEASSRAGEWLAEHRQTLRNALSQSGTYFATSRAAALIDPLAALKDANHGLVYAAHLLQEVAPGLQPAELSSRLAWIWADVAERPARILWTADEIAHDALERHWDRLGLASTAAAPQPLPLAETRPVPSTERLLWPLDAAFNAACIPLQPSWERSAQADLLDSHLTHGILHDLVRERGGAYGVSCNTFVLEGFCLLGSYRDPSVRTTFEAFRHGLESLVRQPPTEEELYRTLLGVLGSLVTPRAPKERGYHTWFREELGLTLSLRQRILEALQTTRPQDLVSLTEELLANWDQGSFVSLCGPEVFARDPLPEVRDFPLQARDEPAG